MAWHIKIGKLSWCDSPYACRSDLLMVARDEGILLMCSYVDRRKAESAVSFLDSCGISFARVVQGACPQATHKGDA